MSQSDVMSSFIWGRLSPSVSRHGSDFVADDSSLGTRNRSRSLHSSMSSSKRSLGSFSIGGTAGQSSTPTVEQLQLGKITEQLIEVLERLSRLEEAVRETPHPRYGNKEAQAAPESVQRFTLRADALTLPHQQVPDDRPVSPCARTRLTSHKSLQTHSTAGGRLTVPETSAPSVLCRTAALTADCQGTCSPRRKGILRSLKSNAAMTSRSTCTVSGPGSPSVREAPSFSGGFRSTSIRSLLTGSRWRLSVESTGDFAVQDGWQQPQVTLSPKGSGRRTSRAAAEPAKVEVRRWKTAKRCIKFKPAIFARRRSSFLTQLARRSSIARFIVSLNPSSPSRSAKTSREHLFDFLRPHVIGSDSPRRQQWDVVMSLLIGATIVLVPLQ